ncbi:acyl-CoA dehydrogenase family protein [Capillimicrobium parvum]|uniref:acyl-CoA dehydrogenase family protein n=1 Tax=Capillimicrobium parvum TaxID=2884022 RepID=UPI00216B45CB|nr:acyl-CoA dehydrogenase family protein [Capillimicrobium parvum]
MDAPATETARRVAREHLAPVATELDLAGVAPAEQLDALAGAGLYGIGVEEDFATVCAVIEILAAACLTTTFVWTQHLGVLLAVGSRPEGDPLRAEWLEPLSRGERRAGTAFTGGALPGPPLLHATQADGGWRLDGTAPWISGWGVVDVLYVAGRDPEDRVVWGLLDAAQPRGLVVEPLELLAVDASATVRADFDAVPLPAERVTAVEPLPPGAGLRPYAIRTHAAMALGVAGRCCEIAGASPLDAELAACRRELDAGLDDPEAMVAARARVAGLTLRASAAALVGTGAGGVVAGSEVERLGREALFLAAFGLRAPIRAALLHRLGAGPEHR